MDKKTIFKSQSLAVFSVFTAVALLLLSLFTPVFAAGEDLSTPANKTGQMGDAITITDLQITGSGNDNVSIAITATSGSFTFGTEDADVSGSGTASVVVSGPRDDVNSTLATLTFTSDEPGVSTITADYGSSVTGVIIDPIGGHAYKIIDSSLTWNQARVAAQQLVYGGVQGYLANVTSESEDEFIVEHLTGNGWIGASDQGNEGDWKWMDGPEANTSFWSGNNAFNGGQPVLGPGDIPLYNNWNWNEPNNSGNEDCAEYIVGQGWNDLNCDGQQRNYVVEFGAASETPVQVTREFTITTTAATRNISTCEQLFNLTSSSNRYDTINLTSDINCAGVPDQEPLFNDGSFQGVFNGNGHAIHNVTLHHPGNYCIALIAETYNATISNLRLANFSISGEVAVGTLIGCAGNTDVESVYASNIQVSADYGYAGGLIGEYYVYSNEDEENAATYYITQSSASGLLSVESGSNIGGLVGFAAAEDGTSLLIEQVYADVDISVNQVENDDIGGLIGEIELELDDPEDVSAQAIVRDAYAWGKVSAPGNWNVGGLIGRADVEDDGEGEGAQIIVERTYASGDVEGYEEVGGLIGRLDNLDTEYENAYVVSNSFAMGSVVGGESNYIGSLIGSNANDSEDTAQYVANYVDRTRAGIELCVGNGSGGECTQVNTNGSQPNYFINNTSNPPLNSWDFENVWVANSGVPPTFVPVTDTDGDGVDDSVEAAGPNNGDANNDGTPDAAQANVASLIDPVTAQYAVLAVSEECSIISVSIAAEDVNQTQDNAYDYPAGLMDFTIDCGENGFTATITQYYYGVSGNLIVRKYNPNTQAYSTIENASTADQTIAGQQAKVASYQVTDGGTLDIDGVVNGTIVDPVGLAQTSGSLASTGAAVGRYVVVAGILLFLGTGVFVYRKRAHL